MAARRSYKDTGGSGVMRAIIVLALIGGLGVLGVKLKGPELVSDLLVHLPMNDTQSDLVAEDRSGNGNHGAISGATYMQIGNGSGSTLDFEDGDSVNLGGLDVKGSGITLAAWVRADSFTGSGLDGRIISKADGIAANRHVFMLSTTRLGSTDDVVLRGRVRIRGETVTIRANRGLMLPDVWYHTAMVYDGSSMKLYLDGVEVANVPFTPPLIGLVDRDRKIDVSVGSQPDGSGPWDGQINEVHIAQRVFSAVEIAALATNNPGLASSTLVHLLLDDSQTGAIAKDTSGNGNDGAISGATYVSESGDGSASSLVFEDGDSLNLGGLDVNGTGITLAAWVRANSFTGSGLDGRIISKADGVAANRHVFMLSTTRLGSTDDVVLRGRVRINGEPVTIRAGRGLMLPDVWYHTAMVYDGSTMKLYLDGVEVASSPFTPPLVGMVDQDSEIDVSVGSQPDGLAPWDGLIDDVLIAQRVYSAAEIATLATSANDSYSTDFETKLVVDAVFGVLANDDRPVGGTLTAILNSDVSNGRLELNKNGSFAYTPESGYSGADSFSYVTNDGALDPAILRVDLNVQPLGVVSDLVHLTLDDSQAASVAEDNSINGNNGIISGATYVSVSGDGSAFSLDFEDGDSVNLGGLDVNGTGVTLAAWVRADSFTGSGLDGRIISKADGIAANRHVFMLSTVRRGSTEDVVLRGRVRLGGETVTLRANRGLMLPDIWYHTAMVYDGSTMKLYLDGEEVASTRLQPPLVGLVDQDSKIDVSVGSQPDGLAPWDGLIDNVRIAQRAFDAAEIASMATSRCDLFERVGAICPHNY